MQSTDDVTSASGDHAACEKEAGKSLFARFLSYYEGEMHLFVADLVCSLAVAAIDLSFPQILRMVSRGLFREGSDAILAALWMLAAGLVCMYAIRFACRYFVAFWGHVMGARMESRMREDLFDAYERMSFSFFDKNKSGDLMSRLVSDLFDILRDRAPRPGVPPHRHCRGRGRLRDPCDHQRAAHARPCRDYGRPRGL